jgi:hypothetical protein
MARMYAKISGDALNSGLLKSGERFKKNKNLEVGIDLERITNKVYREVMKRIKNGGAVSSPKPGEDQEDPNEDAKNKRKKYKLSTTYGLIAGSMISNSFSVRTAQASTDEAQRAMTTYTAVKGVGTLAIGAVSPILAMFLRITDSLVGQYVKNQIQLQYDNARLEYNLTRMNIGRNSTYTYDYEQNKWRARDVENINSSILTQRNGS